MAIGSKRQVPLLAPAHLPRKRNSLNFLSLLFIVIYNGAPNDGFGLRLIPMGTTATSVLIGSMTGSGLAGEGIRMVSTRTMVITVGVAGAARTWGWCDFGIGRAINYSEQVLWCHSIWYGKFFNLKLNLTHPTWSSIWWDHLQTMNARLITNITDAAT